MKKGIFLVLAILYGGFLLAQNKVQLHTPAEILKILTDSKEHYELNQLQNPVEVKDRTQKLNFNNVYRQQTTNGFSTVKYSLSKAVEEKVEKAEDAFHKSNYDEARTYYLEALSIDSTYYTVITYIGQTYGIQKNWDKAIEWYEKVTRLNYIDYMAHWFLADAYDAVDRNEEAKKEILIAHILNRNNPRINAALTRILKNNGLNLSDWVFNPQYSVSKSTDDTIHIRYGEGWLAYALTKAVWAYEPGYSESMGYKDNNVFRELEEKEALIGLLLSEDAKTKALPETMALQKAIADKENNMLQEFIFYEILLPEHPFVAFQLPDSFIADIAAYILKVRCGKI